MTEYAFCEPVWASTRSSEHIREVTDGVLYLGGGIRTPALCGFDLCCGWDVPTGVTEERVRRGLRFECNPTCVKCADLWGRAVLGEDWEDVAPKVEHGLVGDTSKGDWKCSCGWTPPLGRVALRAFDEHLLAEHR